VSKAVVFNHGGINKLITRGHGLLYALQLRKFFNWKVFNLLTKHLSCWYGWG